MDEMSSDSHDMSLKAHRLLCIISFTGCIARILVELDATNSGGERDYRRELNYISIYAVHTIRKRIVAYSWSNFINEIKFHNPNASLVRFAILPATIIVAGAFLLIGIIVFKRSNAGIFGALS